MIHQRWQPKSEKTIINKLNGKHKPTKNSFDGKIKGKPVEVKEVRKDYRFRINKDNHNYLVRNNGQYIFRCRGKNKILSAKKVSGLIRSGNWYKDRKYPHKFINKNKIFKVRC